MARWLTHVAVPRRALQWGVLTWSWPRRLYIQRRVIVVPPPSGDIGVNDAQEAAWHAALQPYRGFLR